MNDFYNQDNIPQIQPQSGKKITESLRDMKAVDLANELEQMLDTVTDEDFNLELIDAYLDALDEKVPIAQIKDQGEAYVDFQRRVDKLTSNGNAVLVQSEGNVPQRNRPTGYMGIKKVAMVSAATICLMFILMVGAQATGINVFGHLAQWTDEIFGFVIPSSETTHSEYYVPFQEALRAHEIPAELAPSWYPEGFQTDGPQYDEGNPFCDSVRLHFIHENGKAFTVEVKRYFEPEDLGSYLFEKDAADVEQYTSNGRTFYIMSNLNTVTAAWAAEDILETIEGCLSVGEVKQIIDSIGG